MEGNTNLENLLNDIRKAIYWNKFTVKQAKDILKIIALGEITSIIANDICEYLEIEKRYNRNEIQIVLNNHLIQDDLPF